MVRIKDVARDAGVSAATVSYVLNNTKSISTEVKKRVYESVERLNYRANRIARDLRSKKSQRISIIIQNIRNTFFPVVLAGMEEAIKEHGYTLTFSNSYCDLSIEKKDITTSMQLWVDGVILDSCVEETQKSEYMEFLNTIREGNGKKIPIVLLERDFSAGGFQSIFVDYYMSAYEATKHLIDIGKRRIVHLTASPNWDMILDRCKGYTKAMIDCGLEDNISIKKGDLSASKGYSITKQMIEANEKFDGIFAVNDQLAIGAIRALKEKKILIPEEVGVVGYDNIALSSMISPSLTTVDVPRFEMGYYAVQNLIKQIEEPESINQSVALRTKLIVRGSTDASVMSSWDFREI